PEKYAILGPCTSQAKWRASPPRYRCSLDRLRAPAQRAGAQRLRALARLGPLHTLTSCRLIEVKRTRCAQTELFRGRPEADIRHRSPAQQCSEEATLKSDPDGNHFLFRI